MSKVSASVRLLLMALVAMAVAHAALASDYYDESDGPPVVRQRNKARGQGQGQQARQQRYSVRQAQNQETLPKPPLPVPDDSVYDHGTGSDPDTLDAVSARPLSAAAHGAACGAAGNACDTCDTCGGPQGCCRCCLCGPPGRFWLRDEYMGFFLKGDNLPVLVATNPAGTLPTTTPLFGGSTVNNTFRSGNWVQGGMWLDCCKQWAITGNYFFVGGQATNYNIASDGNPVLGRPFTDANTGAASQQLIAFPGTVVGGINIRDYNSFSGASPGLRHNLCCWQGCCDPCSGGCGVGQCGGCFVPQNCARLDFLTGFQYYNFNDNLNINENLTSTSQTNGVPIGTQIAVRDSFNTRNNFYGGILGLVYDRYKGRMVYEGLAQVALGDANQMININGNTTVSFPGQTTAVNQGGLLALSSNIGHYTHNNFAAIPMFSGRIGYRLTNCFTAFVGYTFIYWGQVARAGDQIDTTVNPNLLPPATGGGPARPAFNLHESSLWAQGITLGGQINF